MVMNKTTKQKLIDKTIAKLDRKRIEAYWREVAIDRGLEPNDWKEVKRDTEKRTKELLNDKRKSTQ